MEVNILQLSCQRIHEIVDHNLLARTVGDRSDLRGEHSMACMRGSTQFQPITQGPANPQTGQAGGDDPRAAQGGNGNLPQQQGRPAASSSSHTWV